MLRYLIRSIAHKPLTALSEWQITDRQLWKREITVEKAMTTYQQIILTQPNDLNLLGQYAFRLYAKKQWPQLHTLYVAIFKTAPTSLLPEIFKALADISSAPALLSKLRTAIPTCIEERYLSLLYSKLGKPRSALKSINKYFAYESSTIDAFSLRDKLLCELQCGEHENAAKTCEKLLELDPTSIEAKYWKAQIYAARRRPADAVSEITRILSVQGDTQKAFLLQERARCRDEGDIQGKVDDLAKSHSLCPELGSDVEMLAVLYKEEKMDDV